MMTFPAQPDAQVTLANWRTAPFSQWAFHHVREIVPSADIPHDPDRVRPLNLQDPVVWPALPGLPDIETFADQTHTDAVVMLHQGRLIFEHYRAPMTARDPHILMSVSKSMLGLLAGTLVQDGTLALDATAESYLPELQDTGFQGATIRDLLDMRTGLDFIEDYDLTEGTIIEYRKATNWNPLAPGQEASDLRRFLCTLTNRKAPHGGPFDYMSPCTDLLGWIIERATGRRYADVFSERLWSKIGAEAPAYITVDRLGAPRCAGGVCMTTRDLARVGNLVAEDGAGIVPKDWIDDITRAGDADAWANGSFASDFPGLDMHYRSKWYVYRDRGPILMCTGIHGQNLFVDRGAKLVMARFASAPAAVDPAVKSLALQAFEAVRDSIA